MVGFTIETTDPIFEKSYVEYMKSTCGNGKINLPNSYFHNFRRWECGKVFQCANFRRNDIILDVGAMNTFFSIFVAQFVNKIFMTDNFYWATREYMKGMAAPQEWMNFVERYGNGRIKVANADVANLHYSDNAFDKIICISTIEHVLRDYEGITQLIRVLKPGGKLLITTEFNEKTGKDYSEGDGSYCRIYTPETLGKLLSSVKNVTVEKSCIAPTKKSVLHSLFRNKNPNMTQIFLCIKKEGAQYGD